MFSYRVIMKLCILICYFIVLCYANIYDTYNKKATGVKSVKFTNGVEFNNISRGTLLKILGAFEESINARLSKKKVRPVFKAQFANNEYSRPYIYPNTLGKPKN